MDLKRDKKKEFTFDYLYKNEADVHHMEFDKSPTKKKSKIIINIRLILTLIMSFQILFNSMINITLMRITDIIATQVIYHDSLDLYVYTIVKE